MKRFFLFVFAVTVGILFFLAAIGGGWWYYENREPDLTAEFDSYNSVEHEGTIYWALRFRIENDDSEDHVPGEWGLRLYDRNGDIIPITVKLATGLDTKLFANETTAFTFRTQFAMDEELFLALGDMDLSGSRADAEQYLNNLQKFRERFWSDEVLLLNDSIGFRQKLSIKDYYEEQLVHRQQILARQGDPVDDPVYREELEATPFCEKGDTHPCRFKNYILNEATSTPEDFSMEEHLKRLPSLPECNDTDDIRPCKIGQFIIEATEPDEND